MDKKILYDENVTSPHANRGKYGESIFLRCILNDFMGYLARDSSRHRGRVFAVQSRVTARRWVASRQVSCGCVGESRVSDCGFTGWVV